MAMVRELDILTGHWFGVTHCLAPSLGSGRSATTYDARFDLAGSAVLAREQRRERGCLVYQALHVLGWDVERQQYTLHLFDSVATRTAAPAFGAWRDQTLTLERTTESPSVRFEYRFEGTTRYRFRVSTAASGERWNPLLETAYERQGQ